MQLGWLARCLVIGGAPLAGAAGQAAPPLAPLTASRLLVLPGQSVTGASDPRAWLARFDSVVTAQLEDRGPGAGWAYARDAIRYQRQNPSYLTDARALGTRALADERVRENSVVPEPFASRLRAYVGIADARLTLVPVAATLDTTRTPRVATLRLVVADGRTARVVGAYTVTSPYSVGMAAADSLALQTARLFIARSP
jgi:hypothetical protein